MPNAINPSILIFTGSRFATPLIAHLVQHGYLAGVILPVTQSDERLAHEVAGLAFDLQQAGIRWQYATRDQLTPEITATFNANCAIAAAFPFIISSTLIDAFHGENNLGIYNIHASALPQYAGPQPLYWQLRDGLTSTTLVLHEMTADIDRGNILCRRDILIHPHDTLASLHNRASFETIPLIEYWLKNVLPNSASLAGELQTEAPSAIQLRYARRPTAKDCRIDFARHSANEISAMCRAGNGSAFTAFTTIKGLDVQILQASAVDRPTFGVHPGTILWVGEPEGLIVCARNSCIRLDIIASPDGVFTGLAFADRFELDAGSTLAPTSRVFTPQPA